MLARQNPPRQLKAADIVKRLDITPMTIYNWRKGGKDYKPLPAKITSRGDRNRVFFLADDFEQWLRENKPDLIPQWIQANDQERAA